LVKKRHDPSAPSSQPFKIAIYLVAFVTICDQLTKSWVINNVPFHRYLIITPFLNFVQVRNTGVTFGIFNDIDEVYVAYGLIVAPSSLSSFLPLVMAHLLNPVSIGSASSSVAAIGNVIDRIRLGAVVDFLDFYWRDYHWYGL